jgi:hypothetical protein
MPVYGDGTAKMAALGVALKRAPKLYRVELQREIRVAAQPLVPALRDAAREKLPSAGGLNEQVAGQRITVSVRLGPKTAGVRLVTTAPDTSQTDKGFVRHPSPRNNRKKWRVTKLPRARGWWTDTLVRKSPSVTPAVLRVMDKTARRIQGV